MAGNIENGADRSPSRLAALDGLRGLAAFAIVVFHYVHFLPSGPRPYEDQLHWLYARGYHAVALFFILSGYIFFAAYSRSDRHGTGDPEGIFRPPVFPYSIPCMPRRC